MGATVGYNLPDIISTSIVVYHKKSIQHGRPIAALQSLLTGCSSLGIWAIGSFGFVLICC